MANIPIRDIPGAVVASPDPSNLIPMDNGSIMEKTTIENAVNTTLPLSSQAEAEAGADNAKRMSPLRTKQAIDAQTPSIVNTAITALNLGTMSQEEASDYTPTSGLAAVAMSNDYDDLDNLPTLGTAAATDATDYATAAQGVPAGGTTGQVLSKASNADHDTGWTAAGVGDMLSATYDPTGREEDIFAALDLKADAAATTAALANRVRVDAATAFSDAQKSQARTNIGVDAAQVRLARIATTSGAFKDFTGLPADVVEIDIAFDGVSLTGSDTISLWLGDAGGLEVAGYSGSAVVLSNAVAVSVVNISTGFRLGSSSADHLYSGNIRLRHVGGNTWVCDAVLGYGNTGAASITAGNKTLSDVLTQLRIGSTGGAAVFDAGGVQVSYRRG